MPRLFTGLQIPPDIADDIAQFRGGLPGARWMEPSDYHITLRFIGDVGLGLARDIDLELAGIEHVPLEIEIAGLDVFGGRKPRAIVAKVRADKQLLALQDANEKVLRRAGCDAEKRKFLPHVTIARLRHIKPVAVADFLGARSIARNWRFDADEFVIFSSRDSTGGGPYQVEASYPLRVAAPTLRPAISQ